MRLHLPYYLLRRLGRMHPPRPGAAPDPADMGTEFALEASIVGWSDSLLGRGRDPQAATTTPALHDEPPLKWLGGPQPRRGG